LHNKNENENEKGTGNVPSASKNNRFFCSFVGTPAEKKKALRLTVRTTPR
jgi:hypothetical protein